MPGPDITSSTPTDNISKSTDFKELYANHLRLALTPVDIAIWFGRIIEHDNGSSGVEEQFAVRLSPQAFKILTMNLNKVMATYESQFGAINVASKSPEEVMAALRAASNPEPRP